MKLTVEEIIDAYNALEELKDNKNLGGTLSYELFSIRNKLRPIWENGNNVRNELLAKYGKNVGGQRYEIPAPKTKAFNKELDKVYDKVETFKITPIPAIDFKGKDGVSIDILEKLGKLLK